MTEIKVSIGPLFREEYENMKYTLDHEIPPSSKLLLEDEPYCNLQSKKSLKLLKLVINDPRFVFDDLFIARQLYFSAMPSRTVVMKHPMFLKVLRARRRFLDYFYERYGEDANVKMVGMLQRYLQAENAIRYWEKLNRFRITFFLYPSLVKHIRSFKKRYYAPDAPGYLRAKDDFERMIGQY
jgi:hypothetical protein